MKRILRYSLRTALVVTLVAAFSCAYFAKRYGEIKAANVAIKECGGTCGYWLDGPPWLREIIDDNRYFKNPMRISLGTHTGAGNDITDETLATLVPHINKFSKFEKLDLRSDDISDDGVAMLIDLPRLKTLTIDSDNITHRGVLLLKSFPRLERVRIGCANVSHSTIDELQASCPGLEINREPRQRITNG